MWKLIGTLRRKAGISPEEFRRYYENHHVPLAMNYVRDLASAYSRNYVEQSSAYFREEGGAEPAMDDGPQFDCITTIEFPDRAAMEALMQRMADPAVQRMIIEDEARFIDRSSTVIHVCEVDESGTGAEDFRADL